MAEVTVWLCPNPWKAPGIEYSRLLSPLELRRDQELGQTELTVRVLPAGAPAAGVLQVDICPQGREEIACIMCREGEDRSLDETGDRLLEMLNSLREAESQGDCKGCAPLQRDPRLESAARQAANEILATGWFNPLRAMQWEGVSWLHGWGLAGFIPKKTGLAVEEAELEALVAKWMAQGGARGHILNALYRRAGIAFAWSAQEPRGWHVVVIFADRETQGADSGPFGEHRADSCTYSCVRKLQYYRRRITTSHTGITGEIISDFITFRWRNPSLCNLWKVVLEGDVRGPRAEWICPPQPPAAGCAGQIVPEVSDRGLALILGGRQMEFDCVDVPPYPGELFRVWGWLDGVDPESGCNPILIAACYYSQFCYTSGIVTAIRLVEGETVVDERTSGSTPDEWVGDERLRYELLCEGALLTVIPSDFARYAVEERVVIHKGGIHTIKTLNGEEKRSGCQDPEGATENDLLRWDLCRPFPEHVDGAIIPQKFWGI